MTSRLKHKLELENVNLQSAYLNESFVQIGTPLPALAETKKDKLEYVPEWQQEVRDEQGRRRFHGAFTGGYSAGYYNTAGSKEGWAPTTFKSSRSNRANKVQRPEDFMDEEDMQQMNEDRRLENTETFRSDTFTGTKEELAGKGSTSTLESLIAPAQNPIGQTLLQKLGWRPGQGIGPRVTLRKLRIQDGRLGKVRAGLTDDEEMDETVAGQHTFAPRDTKLQVFQAKEDKEGLGYEKGRGMGRLPGQKPAFGASTPHDEDDDPYSASASEDLHFAFDNGEVNDDVVIMGGPSRPEMSSRPGVKREPTTLGSGDHWHDGRPVLAGFELDPLGVPPDKWFEIPDIPPGWHPRPARVWGTTRQWDASADLKAEDKEIVRGAPGKPLTFEQRGAALGEEQRTSKAKSVFEYISEKDRERLASLAAATKSAAPAPLATEIEPENTLPPRAEEIMIPPLSPRTASAALKGFVPYGDDLQKQDRYRSYLASQTYNTKEPDPTLRTGTVDEVNKELETFAQSARIFKPMAFAMSSRFTSGSSSLAASDMKQAKPGLHMYDAEKVKAEAEKPRIAEAEVQKILTPREQAAHDGMYGTITRSVKDFYPVKLLCKRFGVAAPHPDGEPQRIDIKIEANTLNGLPLPSNDASWQDKFIHKPSNPADLSVPVEENEEEERRPRTLAEVGMAGDVNQGRDTLTYTKPSIDIFKAIFASDDSDDSDEEEEDEAKPAIRSVASLLQPERKADPYPVKMDGSKKNGISKPVFAPKQDDEGKGNSTAERKKEKKEKKKRKGVLSFEVEEDGEVEAEADDRRRKKRDKLRRPEVTERAEEGGEGEWVEKPSVNPRLAGRKGAADFM